MDKVVCMHNGILFSLRKEAVPFWQHGWTLKTLCKVKQVRHRMINIAWCHLHVESKIES